MSEFIFDQQLFLTNNAPQADKYCLMRIWGWIPTIGSELPKFSRRYFFTGSVLALCILSAYAWAQFPYDNLCVPKGAQTENPERFFTNVNLTLVSKSEPFNTTVTDPIDYVYCPQSWREVDGISFPPTPRIQPDDREWMARDGDESTERLIMMYGITSLIYLIVFLLVLFGGATWTFFKSFVRGTYSPNGQNQRVDFSSLPEKAAFVPQIKLINRPFPYLACNIDYLDQDLIGWNDPARSYDHYNLIFDVPYPGMPRKKRIKGNTRSTAQIEDQSEFSINQSFAVGRNAKKNTVTVEGSDENVEVSSNPSKFPIFSIVKHYPPKWQQAIFDEQKEGKKDT